MFKTGDKVIITTSNIDILPWKEFAEKWKRFAENCDGEEVEVVFWEKMPTYKSGDISGWQISDADFDRLCPVKSDNLEVVSNWLPEVWMIKVDNNFRINEPKKPKKIPYRSPFTNEWV